jgi:hypothetical protein
VDLVPDISSGIKMDYPVMLEMAIEANEPSGVCPEDKSIEDLFFLK